MKRELVYMDSKSSKFWNIELKGKGYTVTFGRIGTAGQTQTKSFPNEEAARKDMEKLIKGSWAKGMWTRLVPEHPRRAQRAARTG